MIWQAARDLDRDSQAARAAVRESANCQTVPVAVRDQAQAPEAATDQVRDPVVAKGQACVRPWHDHPLPGAPRGNVRQDGVPPAIGHPDGAPPWLGRRSPDRPDGIRGIGQATVLQDTGGDRSRPLP